MIKLIVSDVYGTLVPDGSSKINPEVFDTILKLREKGIQFAIASGRPWASVEHAFEPVKRKIFYVANNGAYVGCCGRSLYVYSIEQELVHRIIKKVRRYPDLEVVYAGANGDYLESSNERLMNWLIESYKFNLTRVDDDMWMDCMAKGVNKGRAIRTIQESLHIKPEETMAFGDQLNDMEMLEQAYYSFAVANARDEVRKAARFQADSNENDGVLKILKHLL